ncbi:cell division protein ZapA [Treponema sp.]|uniref:cell division protein ZapA n=1 Tax=Treponema sp. TaxID=166 RepID=UPI00298E0463|nr:cell division protein ZapA [Treponema sp.]MCR5613736.1 cell division protein ZapA [Treponema sp.]
MGLLQINVLGSSFAIQAKEDDKYLSNLLNYYKQITNEIEKADNLKDPKQTAILAGILLCDELYKEKEKNARLEKRLTNPQSADDTEQINKIAGDLISKIEKVL